MIDHTALKPETAKAGIEKLCSEAMHHHFKSVCINPYWIPLAADILSGSGVKVCAVIGFPFGAASRKTKKFETKNAVRAGADEIDMVINIGALKSKDIKTVEKDIRVVVKAARGRLVKVILETCLLTNEEIEAASKISADAGAHYVETSTSFSTAGATVEAVGIMRGAVGGTLGVKASGGAKDFAGAIAMIKAGATRIGTSAGIAIISGTAAGSDKK